MTKAVLDSNVLVSGLIKRGRGGIPDQILRKIARFELVLSEEILQETYRVLHYPRIFNKFHLTEERLLDYFDYLRNIATIVKNLPSIQVVADDPDDDMILATAIAGNADYIVSGDPHSTTSLSREENAGYPDLQSKKRGIPCGFWKNSRHSLKGMSGDTFCQC